MKAGIIKESELLFHGLKQGIIVRNRILKKFS